MKTATVKAYQVENGFKVHYFTNTSELSIGTILTVDQWKTLCGHPRCNAICTGLEPAKLDDEPLELGESIVSETCFDAESGKTYVDAKEFDAVALELSHIHHWSSDSVLADASLPDAGENNLGTVGIKGNIARVQALAIMRVNAAKELGLDVREVSRVAYRAQNLPVIKSFAKLLNGIPAHQIEPF